jgi:hypothetical protein
MIRVLARILAVLCLAVPALGQSPAWQRVPSPDVAGAERTYPRAIHALAPDDVWIVGEAFVGGHINAFSMHWNGSGWTSHPVRVPHEDFADFGMWTLGHTPSGELWAAGHREYTPGSIENAFFGSHNAVWRWSGSEWELMPTPELGGGSGDFVWGMTVVASDNIWFVGEHHPQPTGTHPALAMRWDGSRFIVTDVPIVNPEPGRRGGNPLNDIAAIAANDIWAVGGTDENALGAHDYSNIQHWDGTRWTHVPGPTPGFFNELFTVAAIAADDVWAAGEYWSAEGIFALLLHWDGEAWTEQPSPGGFRDMVALAADDIWALGGDAVYHYDGAAWTRVANFPEFADLRLTSISALSTTELWATGQESTHSFVARTAGSGSGAKANLQISSLKAPSIAAAGQAIRITDTTRNAGTAQSAASFTQVWLSADKTFGGDVPIGSGRQVTALAAESASTGSMTVSLPSVAPGTYYLIAQADRDGDVTESSEADNTRAKTIGIGPDLTVKGIAFGASPASNVATTISVTTRNSGGDAAPASRTRLYRSTDAKVGDGDVLLADIGLPELLPRGERVDAVTVMLPSGSYYLIAVSDATNMVAESKEGNNKRATKMIVP